MKNLKTEQKTLNKSVETNLEKLNSNEKIKKLKDKLYNSLKNNDITLQLSIYTKLFKTLKSLIKKFKYPKLNYNFNIRIFFADTNNNIFFEEYIVVSNLFKPSYSLSGSTSKNIEESFNKYLKGSLFFLNTIDTDLITLVNYSADKCWNSVSDTNSPILYSINSNGTTNFATTDAVTFNLNSTKNCSNLSNYSVYSGFYFHKENKIISGVVDYTNYTGLSFNSDNGNIIFTHIPENTYFGTCIVGGGSGSNNYNNSNNSNNSYPGGGGGGITAIPYLTDAGLIIKPNVNYPYSVGKGGSPKNDGGDSVFNEFISYGGKTPINNLGGISGTTNTLLYGGNGGDGGNADNSNNNGQNSYCLTQYIPNLNKNINCGGGGGGTVVNSVPNFSNGGSGYGGITYTSDTLEKKNKNGYGDQNGDKYGGGGAGSNSKTYSGGNGIIYLWWFKNSNL